MTAALLLMAIAAVATEILHQKIRRGIGVHPLAAVTALRIALVGAAMAMPSLLLALLKAVGL